MSRYYQMNIAVDDVSKKEHTTCLGVCIEEWGCDGERVDMWREDFQYFSFTGNGSLSGGESEEEFTDRITHAMWKALGRFISVRIEATYLEDLPCESYELDKSDYELWLTTKEEGEK